MYIYIYICIYIYIYIYTCNPKPNIYIYIYSKSGLCDLLEEEEGDEDSEELSREAREVVRVEARVHYLY